MAGCAKKSDRDFGHVLCKTVQFVYEVFSRKFARNFFAPKRVLSP